jgi:outer membrane phospholipase A
MQLYLTQKDWLAPYHVIGPYSSPTHNHVFLPQLICHYKVLAQVLPTPHQHISEMEMFTPKNVM